MFDSPNSSRHLRNVRIPLLAFLNAASREAALCFLSHTLQSLGGETLDVAPQQLRAFNVTILYITPKDRKAERTLPYPYPLPKMFPNRGFQYAMRG